MNIRTLPALLILLLTACGEPVARNTGAYLLLDTSGTYSNELEKAEHIINYTLTRLGPSDSFAVARIDTGSFSEKDIIAKTTFNDRPSAANRQKRQFSEQIAAFTANVRSAPYTDITGGILQGIEYLNEKGTGRKVIFIFSDMKEELMEGYVRDVPLELDGIEVVALNVTKLRSDNIDPRQYLDRLEEWKTVVEAGGGSWRVINDLDRLEKLLGG
jgi:hypothetical protein